MLEPRPEHSREILLKALVEDSEFLDVTYAMSLTGLAFVTVSNFEAQLGSHMLMASKLKIDKKSQYEDLDAAQTLLLKHGNIFQKSTLGQLIKALRESGLSERDVRYLLALLERRNDFIHRFSAQVPLPDEWERYGYDRVDFCRYPARIARQFWFATENLTGLFCARWAD
jgi:hypothetical protein